MFAKLAMFWAVIEFSENFTVKTPKCNYDREHQITRLSHDSEACDRILEICNLLSRNSFK